MFFSSLLQNQPKPTPRAATIFRSAGRDLRNKRSPLHAERSACRAITRGSGGEHSTHIYSIPTSAVRGIVALHRYLLAKSAAIREIEANVADAVRCHQLSQRFFMGAKKCVSIFYLARKVRPFTIAHIG
jgi:hypothetical protein